MKSLPSALLVLVLVPGAASQQASSTSTVQAAAQQVGVEKSQPASPDAVLERSMPSMALILTGDGAGNSTPAACAFIRRPNGVSSQHTKR